MKYGIAFLVLVTGCAALPHFHPSSPCRAQDHNAGWLLERARSWVAPADSSDAAMADTLRVPRAPISAVEWVSDPSVCARAVEAYRQTSGRPEGVSGRAYVIRAGRVYVVLDPEFSCIAGRPVEGYTTAIFDANWRLLSRLGG
jgi:hypothetical protein